MVDEAAIHVGPLLLLSHPTGNFMQCITTKETSTVFYHTRLLSHNRVNIFHFLSIAVYLVAFFRLTFFSFIFIFVGYVSVSKQNAKSVTNSSDCPSQIVLSPQDLLQEKGITLYNLLYDLAINQLLRTPYYRSRSPDPNSTMLQSRMS